MAAMLPLVLMLCMSVCAQAQVRRLAVYTGDENPVNSAYAAAAESELRRLLSPANIDLTWAPRPETEQVFESLVIASFDGTCTVADLSAPGDPGGTGMNVLGDAPVSSGGRVMPFLRVDCTRIVRVLTPLLERLPVPLRNVVFGRALARVIAHEIYHILAQDVSHAGEGVAKQTLSAADLTAEDFGFARETLDRLQARSSPSPAASSYGASLRPE